ncbi:MAG: mannonate dehydratase [Bacteroidales bacterium]
MIKTWRWFGEKDTITLKDLAQMGVEGVVTSLHHIPNGEIWTKEEIIKTKTNIEDHGMLWSVVESLPVTEGIKLCNDKREELIANYKESVRNLGACGVSTVCYNFMPVLDWTRTTLNYKAPNGGETLLFDFPTFVAFDAYVLKRPGAENDYSAELVAKAKETYKTLSDDDKKSLLHNVIIATGAFVDGNIDESSKDPAGEFLKLIDQYHKMGKEQLRTNLKRFLEDIMPVAEEAGVNFAIHPDDPPFPVLGLPRIVGGMADYDWMLSEVPSPNNGITLCTGSLSANRNNDIVAIAEKYGSRIFFAHLRNTCFNNNYQFFESGHLDGYLDMPAIVKALLKEEKRREDLGKSLEIPYRPDHGIRILTDFQLKANPGYPLIGRFKGLSEMAGLIRGIKSMM